jgi:Set1/Ash2 histone methyltransferase complex subunit ASH2
MGASIIGPVGMDPFGYAWCSSGHLYHNGQKTEWRDAFKCGDILGCHIQLGTLTLNEEVKRSTNNPKRKIVGYYGTYLEESISIAEDDPSATNGRMEFYKNGQLIGEAFSDLPSGFYYYPTFSLYRDATVHVNFGPEFIHSPPINALPFCQVQRKNIVGASLGELGDLLSNVNNKT